MSSTGLIAAICTPLADDESLHHEGLERHLEDQWTNGISGILVGGTMGLMQLLADQTYRDLVDRAVRITAGRGEVMVGVGDTSFARTRERMNFVEQFDIDGLVVLVPFFVKYNQADLVGYYQSLADEARKPVFIYTLPALTGAVLEMSTVLKLAEHPNIRGIKCSVPWDWTRQLMDRAPKNFRVIPAQPQMVDHLIRCEVRENLDGIYAVLPKLSASIARAAHAGQWSEAASAQRRLSAALQLFAQQYPLFPACTAFLNARGIPGNFAPRPLTPLSAEQRTALLNEPLVKQHLSEERHAGAKSAAARA